MPKLEEGWKEGGGREGGAKEGKRGKIILFQHDGSSAMFVCVVLLPVLEQPVLNQSIIYISRSIANEQNRMVDFGAGAA